MPGPMTVQITIKADGTAAVTGLKQVQGAIDTTGQKGKTASSGITALTSSLQGLAMTAGAAVSVAALARGFIAANLESQRLSKGLAAVAGSATAGAAEMAYISAQADRLGMSLAATGSAYVSLTAATKGTALEGEGARAIFESVSLAMGKLGRSSADTQGALLAIEQMISKGVVSAEELRGQLGERLPGAFKMAADAMGVTEQELGKMLEKGEILAKDLLPLLSQKLNQLYDDGQAIGGLEPEWNRLVNAMGRMASAADQASSATSGLGSMMAWATGVANSFTNALLATANARAGLGFQTFADDSSKLAYIFQARAKALDEYTQARKRADEYRGDLSYEAGMEADAGKALKKFQDLSTQAYTLRKNLDDAAVSQDKLSQAQASGVGDDMVNLWRENNAAMDEHRKKVDKIVGSYDKQAAKASLVKEKEAELNAAVAAKAITEDKAKNILKQYTASLEDNAKGSGKAAKAHGGAAAAIDEHTKKLQDLIASALPARDDTETLAEATAILAEKFANGEINATEYAEAIKNINVQLKPATEATQDLIDKYDRQGAQARVLAEDQARLNAIIAEGGPASDRAKIALDNLGKAQAENAGNADVWSEMWKNGIKRVDDAFAGLWKDLFSGTKSTLESLKSAITSWLAEVAHALITKPLIVALTASLTGVSGSVGASTTGTIVNGMTGGSTGGIGGLGGLSSIGSWFTGNSMGTGIGSTMANFAGSTFGAMPNWFGSGVANLGMTSNLALGAGSILGSLAGNALFGNQGYGSIGSSIGSTAGAVIGSMILPGIGTIIGGILGGIGGGGLGSLFGNDKEPRPGAYSAVTNGNIGLLEDNIGVKGGFGLTFGMSDVGSSGVDANEIRETFEGFAKVSEALAQFYGTDVAADVEAILNQTSMEAYSKNGIMRYAMDVNAAFDVAFSQIIDAAAATGDSVAVVMKAVVGDLSGTAENMANQIDVAMQTTSAVISIANALEGTDTGKILELGSDLTANALRLVDYANSMKWAGESTADTLVRMAMYMTALDTALELSGNTVAATGQAYIDLARNLAYAADEAKIGIKGLMELQGFYYEQFVDPKTKYAKGIEAAADSITEALKGLLFPTKDLKLGGVVDPLMIKDRDAFNDLINGLDLATESGRKLYVALLQLGPAFDAIFDGAEAFTDWLRPQDQEAESMQRLTDLFKEWGLTLPDTRSELEKLVDSGALTTEQMAILAAYLDDLRLIFDTLGDGIEDAGDKIIDLTDLHIRLATALGDEATALRLQREKELSSAANDASRALLLMIWAAEDMVKLGKTPSTLPFRMIPIDPRNTQRPADTELLVALSRLIGSSWNAFDKDKNNLITLDELREVLSPLANNEEIDKIIDVLDANNDGLLSSLEQLPLLIAGNIAPLFDSFDKDKSGGLDMEELKNVLGGVLTEDQLKVLFALLDRNNDGLIDREEATNLKLDRIGDETEKLSLVVKAVDTGTEAIVASLATGFASVVGALTPQLTTANLIQNETGDNPSFMQAITELRAEITALRNSQQPANNGADELRGAATSFLEAAKTIPERIELVVSSMYSEAGY